MILGPFLALGCFLAYLAEKYNMYIPRPRHGPRPRAQHNPQPMHPAPNDSANVTIEFSNNTRTIIVITTLHEMIPPNMEIQTAEPVYNSTIQTIA
jgi:hypothetical protein